MPKEQQSSVPKGFLILIIAFFVGILAVMYQRFTWSDVTIKVGGHEAHVLVADTVEKVYRGLGKREQIPHDGMMFLFGRYGQHGIVMREMYFPIDILWIGDGVVVDMAMNVQPEPGRSEKELTKYLPREEANIVIELPAGWLEEHQIEIGDSVGVVE